MLQKAGRFGNLRETCVYDLANVRKMPGKGGSWESEKAVWLEWVSGLYCYSWIRLEDGTYRGTAGLPLVENASLLPMRR